MFEFVWNCIVSMGTTLANLASSLVQAGINYVTNLWSAVTTAVTVIVNAFNAFVQWEISTIQIHFDYGNEKETPAKGAIDLSSWLRVTPK